MRVFEALIVLVAAAAIARGTLLPGIAWPDWSPVLPATLILLLALHLALEGWRTQMAPVYVTAAAVILLQGSRLAAVGLPLQLLGGGAGLLLLGAGAVLCAVRPVILTPLPAGPLPIGAEAVALEAGAPSGAPTFRIWYPAAPGRNDGPAPYLTEQRIGLRNLRLGRTRGMLNAPPAAAPKKFPVLIFLPAWGGFPSQNTVLLQDLASHGYLVAAVDAWDPAAYPGDPLAATDLRTPLAFSAEAEAALSREAGRRNAHRQAGLAIRVLDRLAALNAAGPDRRFIGRLDFNRVGVVGYSFGGSVAVQAARQDARFRAVVNLDGWVFTDAYLHGFAAPYLLINMPVQTEADLRSPDAEIRGQTKMTMEDEARLRVFFAQHGGTRAIVSDIGHGNFGDAPLLFPFGRSTGAGDIDPHRARALVDDFLLTFFGHVLRGSPKTISPIFAAIYPDVALQLWPAASQKAAEMLVR